METAERLFADNGFAATSLRAIIAAAGVNLAAIHYHFHSKEGLVRAILRRRLGPMNEQRLVMLHQCETRHGVGRLPLEEVVRAFVAPLLAVSADNVFPRFMSRMYSEPGGVLPPIFVEEMKPIAQRFASAFRRALPDKGDADVYWGAFFTIGMLVHAIGRARMLQTISDGLCDAGQTEELATRIVAFACGGLRSLPTTDQLQP